MFFERKELCCGVHLNTIFTDKFKKSFVNVNFVLPHKAEYAACSSLLADVLTRGTRSYPTLRDIERELDECYGAQLSSLSSVRGESKIVSVSIECIGDHYALDGEGIFERCCKMLKEVLFYPVISDGAFSEEYVESEKQKLLASVQRRKNSKRHYAIDRCKTIMCKDEPFGIPSYGSEEDIMRVDALSLKHFYDYMMQNASIELFYVGSDSKDKVTTAFSDMFLKKPRAHYHSEEYPKARDVDRSRYYFEEADYKQSVLVMGYRTGITAESKEKYAFTVFNSVFGSGVNSKLFKIVREKMNLCYYASCSPDLSKGVAFISSGIDASNEQKTKDAIIRQLADTQNGVFTDKDVEECKISLINAYKELYDNAEGMCGWSLGKVIFGEEESIESVCSNIESVTRDDIISVARKMHLDTVFMLRGISKANSPVGGEEHE